MILMMMINDDAMELHVYAVKTLAAYSGKGFYLVLNLLL